MGVPWEGLGTGLCGPRLYLLSDPALASLPLGKSVLAANKKGQREGECAALVQTLYGGSLLVGWALMGRGLQLGEEPRGRSRCPGSPGRWPSCHLRTSTLPPPYTFPGDMLLPCFQFISIHFLYPTHDPA